MYEYKMLHCICQFVKESSSGGCIYSHEDNIVEFDESTGFIYFLSESLFKMKVSTDTEEFFAQETHNNC